MDQVRFWILGMLIAPFVPVIAFVGFRELGKVIMAKRQSGQGRLSRTGFVEKQGNDALTILNGSAHISGPPI